jgi:integrase
MAVSVNNSKRTGIDSFSLSVPPDKTVKGSRFSSAPIRNVGGKKPWQLDLRYFGGGRPHFLTEYEAKTVREKQLEEVRKHGTSALTFSHADRVSFSVAKDRLDKIGLSIERAVDFCEKHFKQSVSITFRKAIEKIEEIKEGQNLRERSPKQLIYNLQSLEVAVGSETLVSEITQEQIEEWLNGNAWAPYTRRTKRIDIRTFFNEAERRGWLVVNPAAKLSEPRLDDKEPGVLTVDQVKLLLDTARKVEPRMIAYLALGIFCGIRPDELEDITPAMVNLKEGYVRIPASTNKTRKSRVFENMSENCKAWLRLGIDDLPPQNSRGRLNKVRLAAGFEGYRKRLVAGRERWFKVKGMEWPSDCMRHSFASYHLSMFNSQDLTTTALGHRSSDMLYEHYRRIVTKEEAKKFWGIKP